MKTREEINAYARLWYAKNKERIQEELRGKPRTEHDREIHRKASNKYYYRHKEEIRERTKEYQKQYTKMRYENRTPEDIERDKERKRIWREENAERLKEKDRQKYLRRKSIIQEQNKNNRDYINSRHRKYLHKRRTSDPLFKLQRDVPNLIRLSIKRQGYSKKSLTYEILGCTYEELMKHLEGQFEPWMTWNNRSKYNGTLQYGWDIDHIIPMSSALTEEDAIKLNHYTNLQPLDSFVNRYIKKDKVA